MSKILSAAVFAALTLYGQAPVPAGEWPSYGATNHSQKYSSLDQITASNFKDLKVAWSWKSPDIELVANDTVKRRPPLTPYGLKATPLVVKGVMYVSTGLHQIAAIDPATGSTKWVYNPKAYEEGMQADVMGWLSRGVAYWLDGKDDERIFLGTLDGYILAIDAKTGKPILSFGDHGRTDLNTPIPRAVRNTLYLPMGETHYVSVDSPPVIVRDTVIVGSSMSDRTPTKEWPPGYVEAFDVRTGKLKWAFHTVPQDGEFGADTWKDHSNRYSGNVNVWSMMSGDDELGMVYLPLTTPNSDYWGGARKGNGLFAESIVAVEVETGKRVWHFQAVHHGIWDYDFPAAPTLLDITVGGRKIKALAQVSKHGFTYVFDRVTGKPVWPIVERPVPPSNVPGEETAPTQPFPTKPPPFDRQGVTANDIIDFTPELHKQGLEILKNYRYGPLFTPQSLYERGGTRGTIQLPGTTGGANWSGSGADPETGFLYVPSKTSPTMMVLTPGKPSFSNLGYVRNGSFGPESVHPDNPEPPLGPSGLPLIKPPYSRMTAYNLNTGEIAWQVPTGNGSSVIRNNPALKGLDLPPLGGQGSQGGPLITKTLLVYGLTGGGSGAGQLIAYDKKTGATLGTAAPPGSPLGSPMTYMIGGKQYIAVTLQSGQLIALSLPD
jgi:quinoprotein glucose dehydrogenase